METLEQILGEFMGLVQSIQFPQGKYQIVMRYGDQIRPIIDKSNKITIVPYDKGLCLYEISREDSLETLAVFIKKTIDYNIEAKSKGKLYNQKIKELEAIFTEHSLQELMTLRFVIGVEGEELPAEQSVDFESKLANIEMSADEIKEEPKKASKKPKKQEKAKEQTIIEYKNPDGSTVGGNIQNLSQPTCDTVPEIESQESVIVATATTKTSDVISGQVDIKL